MVSVATPLVRPRRPVTRCAPPPCAAPMAAYRCAPLQCPCPKAATQPRHAFMPAGRTRPRLRRAITHDASALHRRH
eukprot:scaffold22599_cov72-Phaeocystis_antarctica.AAC.1